MLSFDFAARRRSVVQLYITSRDVCYYVLYLSPVLLQVLLISRRYLLFFIRPQAWGRIIA